MRAHYLTRTLLGDRVCMVCESGIQENTGFFNHLIQSHTPATVVDFFTSLRSKDSEPTTNSFHCMKYLAALTYST